MSLKPPKKVIFITSFVLRLSSAFSASFILGLGFPVFSLFYFEVAGSSFSAVF